MYNDPVGINMILFYDTEFKLDNLDEITTTLKFVISPPVTPVVSMEKTYHIEIIFVTVNLCSLFNYNHLSNI